ncbi:MAG: hypothetical protein KAI17_20505, partial [Thiotrichaceae bacterium]|nr:hypothetical protein [Thiotrichaceae bacterium]
MIKLSAQSIKHFPLRYKVLALSPLLFSSFFIADNAFSAENNQSSGWNCLVLTNGQWDCNPSLGD